MSIYRRLELVVRLTTIIRENGKDSRIISNLPIKNIQDGTELIRSIEKGEYFAVGTERHGEICVGVEIPSTDGGKTMWIPLDQLDHCISEFEDVRRRIQMRTSKVAQALPTISKEFKKQAAIDGVDKD